MPVEKRYLNDDIIRIPVFKPDSDGLPTGEKLRLFVLFWGDEVRVTGKHNGQDLVEFQNREWSETDSKYVVVKYVGLLPKKTTFRDDSVLKVRFVDIGQGDGAVIETPGGQVLFIDGGEDEHMRRYIQAAYAYVLRNKPLHCSAIIVTHGDADHFAGLTELVSYRMNDKPLLTADRVFHNGLVKAPNADGATAFGNSVKVDGKTYATQLEDDLTGVADSRMNTPFKEWKAALTGLTDKAGNKPTIKRIEYGDDDAFDFLDSEGITVKVLGPITEEVNGKPALRFLKTPGSSSISASHTINGNSIVLKLTYGNVRFLFGADLNEEAEESLLERTRADNVSIAAEVLKVPHHGSADFSPRVLEAIRAVVSVVSSGDESTAKEYIHPRAGLMGALGRYSRATVEKPLIYVTEMVAFFARFPGKNKVVSLTKTGKDGKQVYSGYNAYAKAVYGIVHVRTDGERVLVATPSGKVDQKESYVFHVDQHGDVKFDEDPTIV